MGQSAAAASALAFPLVGGAQPRPIKVGVLHPVTGALAYSGQQCRMGALMAIEDINKAGGINLSRKVISRYVASKWGQPWIKISHGGKFTSNGLTL
jgi:ABC-type branched-subunit amino acid transport system substrate-binding protein